MSDPPAAAPLQTTPSAQAVALVFGKYQVIRRLAVGGMGEIFLARQVGVAGFDRLVILKTLLPELAEQPGFIDQFLDEARVAATLNHPNIVSIYEVGEWHGTYIIAMEFIRGDNLARLLTAATAQGVKVPVVAAVKIAHDAALALDHAHHATDTGGQPLNIVHRDIGLQNIMVRSDGVTKVVDFGIALAANRLARTRTGLVKGKLQYMSPEQLAGKTLDGRSDEFALGVVLWELVTQSRLFSADNEYETLQKITSAPIPRPSTVNGDVSPELDQVIMRMLDRDPAKRYARCADAAAQLKPLLGRAGDNLEDEVASLMNRALGDRLAERARDLTPTGETPFSPLRGLRHSSTNEITEVVSADAQRRRRRRRVLLGAIAAVTVAALGVGSWQTAAWLRERSEARATVLDIRHPVGARVVIDGKAWPKPVPTVVTGLAAGTHEVRLERAGEPPLVKQVAVQVGAPTVMEAPPQAASSGPPTLLVTTIPPGAEVSIDGDSVGNSPAHVANLSADATHEILVSKTGFEPVHTQVKLKAGQNETMTIPMQAKPERTKQKGKAKDSQGMAVSAATAVGYLTLRTAPWTKVFIDGSPRGSTPFYKLELTAGSHDLHLVNEEASVDDQRKITIVSGQPLKLDLKLGK